MSDSISEIADRYRDWIIEKRREIHRYPEVSRKEERTSKLIQQTLEDLNIKTEKVFKTGVTGIIGKGDIEKTIGLRFDIDALAIEEKTGAPYGSQNPGVMHACGHDGHTAMGLGTARILKEMEDQIRGKVKLIFQPAEEDNPHGGGARYMIEEGVLKGPEVEAVLGMHIWPDLPFGYVGSKVGTIMGASDPFQVKITGKGVHASKPYQGVDSIVIGSQIVNNLQTIVSRNISPFEQAVVTIGVFDGGSSYNIIPEEVTLIGTVRTFNIQVRDKVHAKIKEICKNTAKALGGKAEVDYTFGYPPLVNDQKVVGLAEESIGEVLGQDKFIRVTEPAPIGEDFAFFAREVPSAFLWLGCSKEGEDTPKLHSPYFNFDENILPEGVKVMVQSILNYME